jgi:hypothetical protein
MERGPRLEDAAECEDGAAGEPGETEEAKSGGLC